MEKSILAVVSKLMTGERFDCIVSEEKEYRKKDKDMEKLSKQLQEYDLTKEQRQAVDRLVSAGNECNFRYSELVYIQGVKDTVAMLKELDLIKSEPAQ